jgi:hypothetical protein
MFQVAAAIALADANNDEVAFPEWDYAKYFAGDFTPKKSIIEYEHISEFHYSPIPYKPNMAIDGYFQSGAFFQNSTKKIKRMFDIKMNEDFCEVHRFDKSKKQIGIHIRRGDYLNFPNHHPVQPIYYYQNALEYIEKRLEKDETVNGIQIVVFSDDLPWCKENLSPSWLYPDVNEVETLFMMTHCHHYVICNSSFSWWGAYLCKNKDSIVVAPKLWFGPAYAHFNTKDVYCKGWIVL